MSLVSNNIRRLANGLSARGFRLNARRCLYVGTQPPPPPEQLPQVERVPVDWKYVQQLLPRRTVPAISEKEHYPSGWLPQRGNSELPYSAKRTVNQMLPVHLVIKENGVKRLTVVRHIRGDIWRMHTELKKHIESETGEYVTSQVNEATQTIRFKGEFVAMIKRWMLERGL